MTHKFIDDDPIGTLMFQRLLKESDNPTIWCDDPYDPQFIYAQLYWFGSFHALNDEAADEFVRQLPASNIAFGGIRHKWAEKIIAAREPLWHSPCHLIYWPDEECNLPVEYPVRPLRIEEAPLVNRHWDLGQGKAEEYIKERIQKGIHVRCDDESGLVSWAMTHSDGSMGFLYTIQNSRNRGYARAVGIALIKKILEAGETPFGYIMVSNDISLKFSLDIGLKTDGYADYLELPEAENMFL